ncbi:MAG TPA: hypothetical protein PLO59_05065, partial [Bacteroidia bacterium]|nr:hypothetical protein [Bacteroidia bacterium]
PSVTTIYYTYTAAGDRKVVVQDYKIVGNINNSFTAICDGNNGSLPAANVDVIDELTAPPPPLNNGFAGVRIACHREDNDVNILQEGFIIVYQRIGIVAVSPTLQQTHEVLGRAFFCSSNSACKYFPPLNNPANNYCNGSLQFQGVNPTQTLPDINSVMEENKLPQITLDRFTGTFDSNPNADGNTAILTWNYYDGTTYKHRPVMLYINIQTGLPQVTPNFTPTSQANLYLFNNVSTTNDNQIAVSVCSETGNTRHILYAWVDDANNIVKY